ncbi:MAG: hypothetical protein B7Y87_00665 [Sphingomonadales bacterium 32-64-22]|nr:MAG: hypothetical protein B7Y87_00665 [Sphingomonadales bacterium 32-64-22]
MTMRLREQTFAKAIVAGLGALALAACSPSGATESAPSAAAPQIHPESGLAVIPLTVTTADGKQHEFRVEVAATGAEQARGLMFRTEMGTDEGMIFPREDDPRESSFWMRNTVIPLDIIFIGPDRRILNVAANAVPYSEAPVPSAGAAGAVLELNGGRAAELGIKAGDKVEW